jgi:DNA repair exonuclease SbcCD ATPase subunit
VIFEKLTIENFMSIKNIKLNLDNRGLILINGDNRDEDDFKSNGAGKTNLIESLVWVLYGRTLKGVKSDEVTHDKVKKDTKVEVILKDDDDSEYIITRYRKHKEFANAVMVYKDDYNITSKSDKDTNDLIVSILQMDYMTFVSTILFSSKSFKFTSATDSEMKKSFDTMLEFDVLNRCLEVAKQEKSELEKEITRVLEEITEINDNQEVTGSQLQKIKEQKKLEKERNEERLQVLQNQLQQKLVELQDHIESEPDTSNQDLINELTDLNSKKQELMDKIEEFEELQEQVSEMKSIIKSNDASIKINKEEVLRLQREIAKYESKMNDKTKMLGTNCPVCGAEVTDEGLENVLKELTEVIQEYNKKIEYYVKTNQETTENSNTLNHLIEKCHEELQTRKSLVGEKDKITTRIQEILAEQKQTAKFVEQYNKLTNQYENNIEDLEKTIEDCKNRTIKTYDTLIEDYIKQLEEYKQKEQELTQELEKLEDQMPAIEFWIEAYGNQGIKSLMLDNVTPFLNEKANYYLQHLASDIEILFNTQDTLKNGEKREKFNIKIKNKNGGSKYLANSGGEQKRIDLAVNMALQDLVASRSNKKLNIAFYDEAFDALDDIGTERVVELLQKIGDVKNTIFVTSHNENLKALFDNSILVIKENGYSILQE